MSRPKRENLTIEDVLADDWSDLGYIHDFLTGKTATVYVRPSFDIEGTCEEELLPKPELESGE